MKTIDEYKTRFNQLLESTVGNVKPLISEDENFEIDIKEITPEELKKFKDSLSPIKTAACLSNKKRCQKCVEMIAKLESGEVSNRLIEKCFNCEFGTQYYETCENLKGQFKSILIDIQKQKGLEKEEGGFGKVVTTAGGLGGLLTTLQMIIRQTKEMFTKESDRN